LNIIVKVDALDLGRVSNITVKFPQRAMQHQLPAIGLHLFQDADCNWLVGRM